MKKTRWKRKGNYGRAIITLASGSLIAQLITILVAPLLTRIYTPEELGMYALILTAESLLGGIICARYDVSIVSEPNEKNVFPLIKLSILITIVFSTLATIAYGIYFSYFAKEGYGLYLLIFLFLMLIINGLLRVLEAYNNRMKDYKTISSVYVAKTFTQNIGTVILGLLHFSVYGMLFAHVTGMLAGLKKQAKSILPSVKDLYLINSTRLKEVMKMHYRLPLYSAPAQFANRFSYTSIFFFIEFLFGLGTLGFYSISNKALGLPLSVMSNNISKVFFEEASREYDETGKFKKSFNKTSLLLITLAIPMVIIIYLFSPSIFKFAFGNSWIEAGVYVQILAPMFGIRFVVNTVIYGLQIAKKQNLELIIQCLFIIASIGSFGLSRIYSYDIYQYLSAVSISFSIVYIIYYLFVAKYAYGFRSNK
ncbi:lipopolysaccharide biosynthesis protein [Planococcus wigleyi]|uniref:Oligosaccharide flippase family protein n=1 Tax=Planococcus wigleyi TaxID=2762216 RepID=A0ABR8W8N0_9BACL|nr:oligosaccharide flippase family protein [Planococcus wigleyi]MBD8013369.1 oligosaccharide flippase family protein [Planococcus wigleyi]